MGKDKTAKKTPEKHAKRAAADAGKARNGGSAERPPESAEDFGHVLRRLIGARDSQARDQDAGSAR